MTAKRKKEFEIPKNFECKPKYLPDATSFDDLPILEEPSKRFPFPNSSKEGNHVLCPKCKGHGYWNLQLNAYGPGRHFKCSCGQCNFWGWVDKGSLDETCIHERVEITPERTAEKGFHYWGIFCHAYECKKCGSVVIHDSSG